jgi:transposase
MNEPITTHVEELASKDACILELRGQIVVLAEQLEWFKRQLFGKKSERVVELDPKQLLLDGLLGEVPETEEDKPEEKQKPRSNQKRKRRGEGTDGVSMPDGLPIVEEIHELPPEEAICLETGLPLKIIGYEVSDKLAIKPPEFYIRRHLRAKYASVTDPTQGVICAPMPPVAIERSRADVSLLSYFLICKYLDHLPLNRISQIFARGNVHIHRKTMSAWAMQLGDVLSPVYDEMKRRVLAGPALFIDETTTKQQDVGKCKIRYLWVAVGGGGGDPPYRVYHFGTREHEQLDKFIGKYNGAVHSDQYQAYVKKAQAGDFIWQPCGAHARRKFEESTGYSKGFRKWVLRRFRRIFLYERVAWRRDPEARLAIRRENEAAIIDEIICRCKEELTTKTHLPKSKSRRALDYLLTNAPFMKSYIDNPDMRFDNNVAERALRPLTLGRKNWLFVGSDRGGKTAAIVYSILQTCKALEINPQEYLEDILPRVLDHNSNRVAELLPDRWAAHRLAKKTVPNTSDQ